MTTPSSAPIVTIVGSFAVGMTIRAPRFPVGGETLPGTDFDMGAGGKGSNQAVGVARLGADSHLVSRIGNDALGSIGRELWARENVATNFVVLDDARPTGVGIITLNAEGENHIVIDLGANLALCEADVEAARAQIAASAVCATVLEIPDAATRRALQLARENGVTTVLNPAPARAISDELLALADVLTPNESELRILCGLAPDDPTDTLQLARRLLERGAARLVVTRGRLGALIIERDGSYGEVFGVPVAVVDSTGAGDAFNSALIVALARGESLLDAAHYAVKAGAHACTKLGVIPSLPRASEL